MSLAVRRILKLLPKNRTPRCILIEDEFYQAMIQNKLTISDITNVALEQYLQKQGLIK